MELNRRETPYFLRKHMLAETSRSPHRHKEATLTLVLDGRLEETFDCADLTCAPWTLEFKPRGILHTTGAGRDGVSMGVIGLPTSALEGHPLARLQGPVLFEPSTASARFLSLLCREAGNRDPVDDPLGPLLQAIAPAYVGGSRRPPGWIVEVEHYVASLGDDTASLTGLARRFRVHPNYLARVFRKHLGCSIGERRRRARIDRAVRRLALGGPSLTDLALELGYHDQSHFTRDFKRETGMPPGRMRSIARGKKVPFVLDRTPPPG